MKLSFLRNPRFLKISLALLAVVIVIGVVIRLMLPGIIRGKIESIGTDMAGVEVRVEKLNLSLLRGAATLRGVSVASPEGFADPQLVTIARAGANVGVLSLLGNTMVVDNLDLHGVQVNLHVREDGQQNLRALVQGTLAKLEEMEAEEEKDLTPEERERRERKKRERREKKADQGLLLKRINISDIALSVRDDYAATYQITTALQLGELNVRNVPLPPASSTADHGSTRIQLDRFHIEAPDRFLDRRYLELEDLLVEVEVGRAMQTIDRPQIVVPLVQVARVSNTAEQHLNERGSTATQNMNESIHAINNAVSMEEPKKLDESSDRPRQEEREQRRRGLGGVLSQAEGTLRGAGRTVEQLHGDLTGRGEQEVEEAPPPFEYVKLHKVSVDDFTSHLLRVEGETATRRTNRATINLQDLVYPNPENSPGNVNVSVDALLNGEHEGSMTLTMNGSLADFGPPNQTEIDFATETYPLTDVPGIRSGVLTSTFRGNIEASILRGRLMLHLQRFDYESSLPATQRLALQTVRTAFNERPTREIPIPPTRIGGDSKLSDTMLALLTGIATSGEAIFGDAAAGIESGLRDISERIPGAGEDTLRAIEGGGRQAEDALRDTGRRLEGLFGRRRSEDPTPTPVPEN